MRLPVTISRAGRATLPRHTTLPRAPPRRSPTSRLKRMPGGLVMAGCRVYAWQRAGSLQACCCFSKRPSMRPRRPPARPLVHSESKTLRPMALKIWDVGLSVNATAAGAASHLQPEANQWEEQGSEATPRSRPLRPSRAQPARRACLQVACPDAAPSPARIARGASKLLPPFWNQITARPLQARSTTLNAAALPARAVRPCCARRDPRRHGDLETEARHVTASQRHGRSSLPRRRILDTACHGCSISASLATVIRTHLRPRRTLARPD